VEGVLLQLVQNEAGFWPGSFFWKLFGPIRQDLDRLFWCFLNQPWMGAPAEFPEDESVLVPFEGQENTSIQLWRPGSLSRFAHHFGEEFIDLWGIEPTRDDPAQLVTLYNAPKSELSLARGFQNREDIIRQHARVWLLYTDSTCWEIYARKASLLKQVRTGLIGKPWVKVYDSNSDRRASAFGAAGLSEV
jgi:hypothetical protein